jgi:hypothetical protein
LVFTAVESTVKPKELPDFLQFQWRLWVSEPTQNLVDLSLDVLGFIPGHDDVLH